MTQGGEAVAAVDSSLSQDTRCFLPLKKQALQTARTDLVPSFGGGFWVRTENMALYFCQECSLTNDQVGMVQETGGNIMYCTVYYIYTYIYL